MRPITLSMSAFGPFSGKQEINFEDLGEHPLFLINGPTGAGKTTILDAICYALYGKTTGDERDGKQMRCDYADMETLTQIEFVFELAGAYYKISRTPEQDRQSKRGDGVITQKAQATLTRITKDGEDEQILVAAKTSEATREIENLTGLDADQFRQVMVLPQGKFRDLLMASSIQREAIFEQLFETDIYPRLEDALREEARELEREVRELIQQQRNILDSVDMETVEELKAAITELGKSMQTLAKEQQALDAKHVAAIEELAKAESLEKQFAAMEDAQKEARELKRVAPQHKKQKLQLQAAIEASKMQHDYERLEEKQAALLTARAELAEKSQDEQAADKQLVAATKEQDQATAKKQQLDQRKNTLTTLEGYRERSRQLDAALQTFARADKALKSGEAEVAALNEKLRQATTKREETEQQLDPLRGNIAQLPGKKVALEKLDGQVVTQTKLQEGRNQINSLGKDLKTCQQDLNAAQADQHQCTRLRKALESAWQQGQAAILADELKPGEPCSVCGSTDHPSPAVAEDALPRQGDIDNARMNEEKAARKVSQCQKDNDKTANQIKIIETRQKDYLAQLAARAEQTIATTRKDQQQLQQAVKSLEKDATRLPLVEDQVKEQKQKEKTLADSLEKARKQQNKAGTDQTRAQTEMQNKQAELPENYRVKGVLETDITRTRETINALETLIKAVEARYQAARDGSTTTKSATKMADKACQKAEKDRHTATEKWQAILQKSSFLNLKQHQAARLEEEDLKFLQDEVKAYETRVLLSQKSVEEKTAAVKDKQRPKTSKLTTEVNEIKTVLDEINQNYHDMKAKQKQLSKQNKSLRKTERKQRSLEDEYKVIGYISKVANGDNEKKISLHRFVLSVLLDDVLREADQRLQVMSKGRYRLLRRTEVTDKRLQAGLELDVEDAYSGKVRPVATLSGGESFMAALSMALGLSDVVQGYAGGIRLDTLFIDEGFGSLDTESLELAIDTLIDLQKGGRMVGIISHVPELKERIDVRLDLTTGKEGSRVELVVA